MSVINYLKKIIKDLLFIPLYYLSFLIPRNKNIWIFQCWDTTSFIDNSKYFYLYCSKKKEVQAILISKNKKIVKKLQEKNYNAKYIWSLSGIWSMLRAGEYIIDNAFIGPGLWMRGNARVIQLWHGTGIKKVGYDLHGKKKGNLVAFYKTKIVPWKGYRKKDIFIVPSKHYAKMIAKGFRINLKNVLNLGFPRNDFLINKIKDSELFNEKYLEKIKKLKQKKAKLILYAPTWGHKDIDIEKLLNFKKVIPLLEQTNSYLLIKPHKIDKKINGKFSSRIIVLPKYFDLYTILKDIDILVTDYSSIWCDFLFIDKPIIFYPYDLEWYKKNVNPFHYNFYKHAPGPIVKNSEDFFKQLKECLNGKDNFAKERKKELDFWFDYKDNKASERIYNYIRKTR